VFPLQQWLRERATMLRYMHIVLFILLYLCVLKSVLRQTRSAQLQCHLPPPASRSPQQAG